MPLYGVDPDAAHRATNLSIGEPAQNAGNNTLPLPREWSDWSARSNMAIDAPRHCYERRQRPGFVETIGSAGAAAAAARCASSRAAFTASRFRFFSSASRALRTKGILVS